jgi:hypothetical protein
MNNSIHFRTCIAFMRNTFFAICIFGAHFVQAQVDSNDFLDPVEIPPYLISPSVAGIEFSDMDSLFEAYTVYNFDFQDVFDTAYADDYHFYFNLVLGDKNFESIIWRYDIRSADWKAAITGSGGTEIVEERDEEGRDTDTWKGYSNGADSNFIRLAIVEDNFFGFFYDKNEGEYYYVQSLMYMRMFAGLSVDESHENKLIVYKGSDDLTVNSVSTRCLTSSDDPEFDWEEVPNYDHPCAVKVIEIAIDIDFSFYEYNLENLTSLSEERVQSVTQSTKRFYVFLAEHFYSLHMNIMFSLTYQDLQVAPLSNYNKVYATEQLDAFRIYRQSNWQNIRRDLAVLFSLGPKVYTPSDNRMAAGIGYLGITNQYQTICGGNYGYSVICQAGNTLPQARAITIAHEIGHNLGATHPDEESNPINVPNCGLMCSGGSRNNDFHSFSKIQMLSFIHQSPSPCLNTITHDDALHYQAFDWLPAWYNKNNFSRIGGWLLKTGDTRLFGDMTGDGIDEMICMSPDAKWCNIDKFNCQFSSWGTLYSNNASGQINTFNMREHNKYFLADFGGDGKKNDLICISSTTKWATIERYNAGTNQFGFLWSNMGNYNLASGCRIRSNSQYIIGDFNGDGTDELLYFSSFLGVKQAALIDFYYDGTKYVSTVLWNRTNGYIGSVAADPSNFYIQRGFSSSTTKQELLTIVGEWATILEYNPTTNHWDWKWSQYGQGGHFAYGITLPLANSPRIITGDFDYDGQDEIFHARNKWLATIDYNNGSFYKNWDNYDTWDATHGYFVKKDFFKVAIHENPNHNTKYYTVGIEPGRKSVLMLRINHTYQYGTPKGFYESYIFSSRLGSNKRSVREVNDQTEKNNITKVYPNPTDNIIIVKRSFENMENDNLHHISQFELIDMTGKIIRQGHFIKEEERIEMYSLPSGIYFLRFNDNSPVWKTFRINKL